MNEKDKDKLAKQGMAAGALTAGTGGAILVGSSADKLLKNNPKLLREIRKSLINKKGGAKAAKEYLGNMKTAGKVMTGAGVAVAGVSAYKHYKNKKKDDNTEK